MPESEQARQNRIQHLREYRKTEKYRQWFKQYYEEKTKQLKEELANKVGNKCFICETTERSLRYHEKNFNPHPYNGSTMGYILAHKEDFTPLCQKHHDLVHWLKELTIEQRLRVAELVGG